MSINALHPLALALLCAIGYAASAVVMRAASGGPQVWHLALIAAFMAVSVITELALLRQLHLGTVYLAVLGLETLLVLTAAFVFGDHFGPREIAATAMILGGTLLLGL